MRLAVTEELTPRVLLVEDEEPILDGLDALLSGQGFDTTRAADGSAALDQSVARIKRVC